MAIVSDVYLNDPDGMIRRKLLDSYNRLLTAKDIMRIESNYNAKYHCRFDVPHPEDPLADVRQKFGRTRYPPLETEIHVEYTFITKRKRSAA